MDTELIIIGLVILVAVLSCACVIIHKKQVQTQLQLDAIKSTQSRYVDNCNIKNTQLHLTWDYIVNREMWHDYETSEYYRELARMTSSIQL